MATNKTSVIYFLNELDSKEVKSAFEFLNTIVENLENQDDPDPIEMEIVDSAYQTLEKLNVLKNNLRTYVRQENKSLPGSRLLDLYERGGGVR